MKIAIIGRKPYKDDDSRNVRGSIEDLIAALKVAGHEVYIETETWSSFKDLSDTISESMVGKYELIGKMGCLGIVIGGDGTMLEAARKLASWGTSLIGINQGRLGFITDIPKDEAVATIKSMLAGDCTIERRPLIETIIGESRAGKALNDVVASRAGGRVIEFNVHIDQVFAFKSRGDGLMISTPTGSTAYALAAGGPIISPLASVFEVIPMMPQTLSYRPLVINDTSRIEMELIHGEAEIFVDGNESGTMKTGDILLAQKAKDFVNFMHPLSYNHYQTLRGKLGWQNVPGEKR